MAGTPVQLWAQSSRAPADLIQPPRPACNSPSTSAQPCPVRALPCPALTRPRPALCYSVVRCPALNRVVLWSVFQVYSFAAAPFKTPTRQSKINSQSTTDGQDGLLYTVYVFLNIYNAAPIPQNLELNIESLSCPAETMLLASKPAPLPPVGHTPCPT